MHRKEAFLRLAPTEIAGKVRRVERNARLTIAGGIASAAIVLGGGAVSGYAEISGTSTDNVLPLPANVQQNAAKYYSTWGQLETAVQKKDEEQLKTIVNNPQFEDINNAHQQKVEIDKANTNKVNSRLSDIGFWTALAGIGGVLSSAIYYRFHLTPAAFRLQDEARNEVKLTDDIFGSDTDLNEEEFTKRKAEITHTSS